MVCTNNGDFKNLLAVRDWQRLDTWQKPAVDKKKHSFLVLASLDSDQTVRSCGYYQQVSQTCALAATQLIHGFRQTGNCQAH